MYGLNPDTDVSPLRGCTLTFVGFGLYQVQLRLLGDLDCAISIEGDYAVKPPGGALTTFSGAVDGADALLALLGSTIVDAAVPTDGTIRVSFANGFVVQVPDSQKDFESYQINLGERLLVV